MVTRCRDLSGQEAGRRTPFGPTVPHPCPEAARLLPVSPPAPGFLCTAIVPHLCRGSRRSAVQGARRLLADRPPLAASSGGQKEWEPYGCYLALSIPLPSPLLTHAEETQSHRPDGLDDPPPAGRLQDTTTLALLRHPSLCL
ncbi:hypothetical protein NDU88_006399 [Pleurodeles waltl]|uniref:Uncharacterized protein n=1 Tax=Pleurodeles waltl TaxID=8319 RepID=A0AAV7QNU6_PLEWA|nr:hypothetical protein NDU88_006399 [Pleurodeles waltl]